MLLFIITDHNLDTNNKQISESFVRYSPTIKELLTHLFLGGHDDDLKIVRP